MSWRIIRLLLAGILHTLEAGKLADFVLLDRDLSRVPVNRIKEAQVRMTVVGGRVEYSRDAAAPVAAQPADR